MEVFKIHWMLETGTRSFKQTNTHTLVLMIHLALYLWHHKHEKKMDKMQCKSLTVTYSKTLDSQ